MNTLLQQGRTVRDEGCKTLGYGRHGDEPRDGEMAVSVTTVW